jgi:hypothetical protein
LSLKEKESLFQGPDLLQQKAIERWAKSLGLVFEYDAVSGRARVGRVGGIDEGATSKLRASEMSSYESLMGKGVFGNDLDTTTGINSEPPDNTNTSEVPVREGQGAGHSDGARWSALGQHEIKDNGAQTDHADPSNEERAVQRKAVGEDRMSVDNPIQNSREGKPPQLSPGEIGVEKMANQISDGSTELQGSQPDSKSPQDSSKNEISDTTWSTIHQAQASRSAEGPSADIISSDTTTTAMIETTDYTYSTIEKLPVSSTVNSTMSISAQNALDPTSPMPHLYSQSIPTWNLTNGSHFPGPLLWAQVQPIFPPPTKDPEEALRLVEEKRARNAAAPTRFRYNRKVMKEEKKAALLEALEQNIADLERRLREMEAEKEFYRFERDRFRDVVLRIPRLRYLAIPSAKL